MKYKYIFSMLILSLTSSCAVVKTSSYVKIGQAKEMALTLSEDAVIELNITAGDISIEKSPNDKLTAEMTVECPSINSKCAKRMAGIEFVKRLEGNNLTLTTNRDSLFQQHDANLKMKFFIPKSQQLNINMDAGDLRIKNIEPCLNVDMSAGEINIKMPSETIASVRLNASVGEASLNVNGIHQSGNRQWLVGGKVYWNKGVGHCQMQVDLQAGEISMSLADTL